MPSSALGTMLGSTLGSASSGISPFSLSLKAVEESFSFEETVLVWEPAFSLSERDMSIMQGVFYIFNRSASFSAAKVACASLGSFRGPDIFG